MTLVDSNDGTGREVNRYGHLMSFRVDGPPENARKAFDGFKMIFRATDLGRSRAWLRSRPYRRTNSRGEEARKAADVPPQLIRRASGPRTRPTSSPTSTRR